jgi:hypothetical protein
VAFHALQAIFDDQFLAAHLVAELVAYRGPARLRKRDRPDLFFADRAGQDFEELGLDRHGGAECTIAA